MNTLPVLLILLSAMVQTILAVPMQSDDWVYTTEGCPPGIWVCKKRRSEIPVPAESDACPPGVWTCQKRGENVPEKPEPVRSNSEDRNKREIEAPEEVSRDATQYDDSDDPESCPPGIWVCRKRRMLKRWMKENAIEAARMLNNARDKSTLRAVKKSNSCPPGIWVC